ncbi:MAG: sigma-70 family RNA polymerase sigma factor [Isosphaeraceae bacterium]
MADEESRSRLQTRPSLLFRLRDAGDDAAWRTFVDLYAPVIYGYGRRRGLNDSDAADVVQEVLVQVTRSIPTFDYRPERGRFRGWLLAVTRSKIARARRRANPAASGPHDDALIQALPDAGEDPDWLALYHAEILRVALERIRPDFEATTWRMFEEVWRHDRPAAEVARELDRPIHAVYVAKSRVLQRLRDEVEALADDLTVLDNVR